MKLNHYENVQQSYRIALITSQAFSISNFRGPLVIEMVRRGVSVYALAPDYDDASRSAVRALGALPVDCSMSRTGMNPLRDFINLIKLSIQLRSMHLNAIFAYFIKPVIYGTLAATIAAVPERFAMIEGAGYVFTEGGKPSVRHGLLRYLVTWLYQYSLGHANIVFLLNPDDKELFVNNGMVAKEKVKLLDGIGLDLKHFHIVPPVLKPICFIFIARMLQEKGVYDYIEAARKVKTIYPEVRFLMLGCIDLNPGSVKQTEINTWVAEGLIEWPGHVQDVRMWIAQSSVFVLPSYYREGLPRSTQEAMAMGRPIITSDAPGCRETVDEGVNGFMVPVRNPERLACAMLNFVENPELISSMGAASRKIAELKFDVHKINSQILESMKML